MARPPCSALLEPVGFEAPIERAAGDAEQLGRLADVSLALSERPLDQEALPFLERHLLEVARRLRGWPQRQIRGTLLLAAGQKRGSLHGVLQLPDVARPAVLEK